jgi:hypothetical protein
VTPLGFRQIAGRAGATVTETPDGWLTATHPSTGSILQLAPAGGLTVHAEHGSWHSGPNSTSTLTAIWKGTP